ncbi:CDP-glycerol glycerophosphotransferase family protein [Neobacillus sp. YIM B02564]|uniref:CDP-glycerol glycerophosphotransferase family protein n=1 Tax=Neobacillus paridis TaxID=2803862 RepID=A0ABS1TV31_9BACI|nr:CDP-glycerol glycerophosphotransferase family protein [Neobacillus paridis]MBL4955053.1 CDP-glycerol glycerophosphotransferase family protein [Neobacillus paridis]
MARELAISLYLFVFKCVFSLFHHLPLKDKTTFVISFGDNSYYVFEEMQRQNIHTEVVFLCKGKAIKKFREYQGVTTIPLETANVLDWCRSIYHLATSRYILIDNYFGFLASVRFKPEVECIQLWHASGALKKFGLEDESVKYRSKRANRRFQQVYNRFDKVVVGSDVMAETFIRSFGLNENHILRTGVPRTDFFFNEAAKQRAMETLLSKFPEWAGKKLILYAPTYRDTELNEFSLHLDIKKMRQKLGDDFILMLRLHPAVRTSLYLDDFMPDFLYDFSSDEYEINELLLVADILITDYSSIPFEFSLLHRPMIFFTYDLEEYKAKRGLLDEFPANLPGPIVKDTDSIINLIKENNFNFNKIDQYAKQWNKYSNGHSSANLVRYLFQEKSSPQAYEKLHDYS